MSSSVVTLQCIGTQTAIQAQGDSRTDMFGNILNYGFQGLGHLQLICAGLTGDHGDRKHGKYGECDEAIAYFLVIHVFTRCAGSTRQVN